MKNIMKSLIPEHERDIFYSDPVEGDCSYYDQEYYDQYVLSIRRNILKESDKTIESARKREFVMSVFFKFGTCFPNTCCLLLLFFELK